MGVLDCYILNVPSSHIIKRERERWGRREGAEEQSPLSVNRQCASVESECPKNNTNLYAIKNYDIWFEMAMYCSCCCCWQIDVYTVDTHSCALDHWSYDSICGLSHLCHYTHAYAAKPGSEWNLWIQFLWVRASVSVCRISAVKNKFKWKEK